MTARVLVLSVAVPWPAVGGGRMRTARLVDAVRSEYAVTVVAFTYAEETYDEPPPGVELVTVPYSPPRLYRQLHSSDAAVSEAALKELQHPEGDPWLVTWYSSPAMSSCLRRLSHQTWSAVLVEGSDLASYLDDLPPGPVALDLMDVCAAMHLRGSLAAGPSNDPREAERVRRFERRAAQRSDAVLVCSEEEQSWALRLLGVDTIVVPNGVDVTRFGGAEDAARSGHEILFTGTMSYPPNAEAAQWFAQDVMPLVRESVPTARLHIAGASPPPAVLDLRGEGVVVHGTVPDMVPLFAEADVVVVPVLSGGGTRLKVLEAAAAGCPIVSTPLGCEGLALTPGRDLLVARDADAFAAAVVGVLADPAAARRLGEAARIAARRYDWSLVTQPLRDVVSAWSTDDPRLQHTTAAG